MLMDREKWLPGAVGEKKLKLANAVETKRGGNPASSLSPTRAQPRKMSDRQAERKDQTTRSMLTCHPIWI